MSKTDQQLHLAQTVGSLMTNMVQLMAVHTENSIWWFPTQGNTVTSDRLSNAAAVSPSWMLLISNAFAPYSTLARDRGNLLQPL